MVGTRVGVPRRDETPTHVLVSLGIGPAGYCRVVPARCRCTLSAHPQVSQQSVGRDALWTHEMVLLVN